MAADKNNFLLIPFLLFTIVSLLLKRNIFLSFYGNPITFLFQNKKASPQPLTQSR